jgi:hypothetical protein
MDTESIYLADGTYAIVDKNIAKTIDKFAWSFDQVPCTYTAGRKKTLMEMVLRLNAIPVYKNRNKGGGISHKDGDCRNNTLANLELRVTEDVKYVYYVASKNKWTVRVPLNNNYKNGINILGNFDTKEEAIRALARYTANDLSFGKKLIVPSPHHLNELAILTDKAKQFRKMIEHRPSWSHLSEEYLEIIEGITYLEKAEKILMKCM